MEAGKHIAADKHEVLRGSLQMLLLIHLLMLLLPPQSFRYCPAAPTLKTSLKSRDGTKRSLFVDRRGFGSKTIPPLGIVQFLFGFPFFNKL